MKIDWNPDPNRPKFDLYICIKCGNEVWIYPKEEEQFHSCGGLLNRCSQQEKIRRAAEYLFSPKY